MYLRVVSTRKCVHMRKPAVQSLHFLDLAAAALLCQPCPPLHLFTRLLDRRNQLANACALRGRADIIKRAQFSRRFCTLDILVCRSLRNKTSGTRLCTAAGAGGDGNACCPGCARRASV